MHRIGNDESLRQRRRRPPLALAPKHASVDKRPEQFFEEERISLCTGEHLLADRRREIRVKHFPKELLRLAPRKELDLQQRSALGQSGAPAVWKVGPSRRYDRQRRLQITDDALDEVEQGLLAPMKILEHDQQRLVLC